MNMAVQIAKNHDRYAKCVNVSRRVDWKIDEDVIRGRQFDLSKKFLPDGLSRVDELPFLNATERRFISQVQGRTYANMFGLVERFINSAVLDATRDFHMGDQVALEALVQFSAQELKHQELFRRLDQMASEVLPDGYEFAPDADKVAEIVLSKSRWSVMGLTLLIELFTQEHYRESIAVDENLSDLWKDVFLFHWQEESQHAILDELEWQRLDEKLTMEERDSAVDDLIALVAAVDGILQAQAEADARYFVANIDRSLFPPEATSVQDTFLKAYRWQYIVSGTNIKRFTDVLGGLITNAQAEKIFAALGPIAEATA